MRNQSSMILYIILVSLYTLAQFALSVSGNKVAELIHMSVVATVLFSLVSNALVVLLWIKLYRYQGAQQVSASQSNEVESIEGPERASVVQEGKLRVVFGGIGGLMGGLIWFMFGLIGCYVGFPLMLISANLINKHQAKTGHSTIKQMLRLSTFCCVLGLTFEFLVASVILATGVPLYMNHVAIVPLMRTIPGFLIALGGGVLGAYFGATE